MATSGDLIRVEHVIKEFNHGAVKALNDCSLTIQKGEVVAIIGPSGSGKSTLLRCLNLLEVPSSGHIYFNDVDITDKKVDIDLHRRKMGMVFQHFNLFPHMTVQKNITLAPVKTKLMSQEEADSLWLRLGASGIDACLQGEGAEERLSLLRLSFAHPERLDRYQAELARSPETSPEEAVVRVNIGLDAPPYGVGEPVDEPASLTALVNKYHPLPADYVPELELLPPGYTASQGARLRPEACAAFLQMADAAAEEGLRLYSASPYRSYAAQERVYQRYAAQQGAEAADTYSARAGFSEHQTGLALDINVASLSARFEETAEYAWLSAHSWEYGFILRFPQGKEDLTGYLFEPWHYRYVGPETARLCHEQGWTLEEFWARQPVCGTGPVLTLEGEPLSFSRLPLVLDGDVYVPAEELARAIGWASAEQPDGTLLLWGERRQARLFEGRSLLSGGSSVSLDCPVIRANGVLMAPVKALCQALDLPCEQGEAGLDLRTSADTWDWVQKLDQSCRQHGITLEQAVGGLAVDRLERWIRPAERWLSPQLDLFFWAAGRK